MSDKFFKGFTHIALPIKAKETKTEPEIEIVLSKKITKSIEAIFSISFLDEIKKSGGSVTAKAGEVIEIPVLQTSGEVVRILLVGVGESSNSHIRKASAAIGRKIKASKSSVLSFLVGKDSDAQLHFISTALATYIWSQKSGTKSLTPEITLVGSFADLLERSRVLVKSTWKARDLIQTPANIKNPAWMAAQAKSLAKSPTLSLKIRSGRQLAEFGGLSAIGNSSAENPPRFVELSYKPKGSKRVPHVVLVGKGITFDTGGVSLKRPYDVMTAMKSDMAGAACVLMATIAAAELKLDVRITALLMLAENALSGTSTRPSDVITHYGGTTVEVINTDAEGRLVLADGLAYADKNLEPDYLIDVATLTGAATLGLSRYYGAMYTRDSKLARKLSDIGDYTGDQVWHMPLVDDYSIALESNIADFNHTADKFKFQGGSVTAALFLENFVGKRKWVHLDIAGPARSEVDAGEYVKGGTGYGVRLLTQWLATL
ncbi:MAG: leucyl aminopeptidase family protein [Actinobacteria bacterium]|nr:leucyl aminopeptidase family protein [Actinomycetota bacterium]NCZ72026.1 leucyl aminopeptidase family protein [Actinomycetota bacterium]NDE26352.1 leucyl aminopeptidase family protein [Actinomycetota bacterium]NDE36013.1 leucyl aminopeptidase family protein [Actinomycetota bacterium]